MTQAANGTGDLEPAALLGAKRREASGSTAKTTASQLTASRKAWTGIIWRAGVFRSRAERVRVLVTLLLIAALGCDGDVLSEEHFSSSEEARKARLIERHGLPAWFPSDARQIMVVAGLDYGDVWLHFMSEMSKNREFASQLEPCEPTKARETSKAVKSRSSSIRGTATR